MNINEVHWNFSDNGTKEPAKILFWNFFWTAWNFLMRFSLLCSGEWALSFYVQVFIYIGVYLNSDVQYFVFPFFASKISSFCLHPNLRSFSYKGFAAKNRIVQSLIIQRSKLDYTDLHHWHDAIICKWLTTFSSSFKYIFFHSGFWPRILGLMNIVPLTPMTPLPTYI